MPLVLAASSFAASLDGELIPGLLGLFLDGNDISPLREHSLALPLPLSFLALRSLFGNCGGAGDNDKAALFCSDIESEANGAMTIAVSCWQRPDH